MTIILAAERRNKVKAVVSSLVEAREEFLNYRDGEPENYDILGASEMHRHCGEVWEDGRQIARISYNGRIWTPEGQELICAS